VGLGVAGVGVAGAGVAGAPVTWMMKVELSWPLSSNFSTSPPGACRTYFSFKRPLAVIE